MNAKLEGPVCLYGWQAPDVPSLTNVQAGRKFPKLYFLRGAGMSAPQPDRETELFMARLPACTARKGARPDGRGARTGPGGQKGPEAGQAGPGGSGEQNGRNGQAVPKSAGTAKRQGGAQ